ncbi:MAG: hypothetical protein LBJ38_01810, partial [Oscillospiraceae bacterium]|nr:hypothetical protein [Oscillospiraceae bacterium]
LLSEILIGEAALIHLEDGGSVEWQFDIRYDDGNSDKLCFWTVNGEHYIGCSDDNLCFRLPNADLKKLRLVVDALLPADR